MATCPNCGGSFSRRKDGSCPGCGVAITIIEGRWFLEDGKILDDILKHWNGLVCKRNNLSVYITPRNMMYKAEKVAAAKLLVEAGSKEVTKEALDFLFTNPKFSWKTYTSLFQVIPDWLYAISIVRQQKEKREQLAKSSQEALDNTPTLDIFKEIYGNS